MIWCVQFTARKRAANGERYAWHHGLYTKAEAHARAAEMRAVHARKVRVEVLRRRRL